MGIVIAIAGSLTAIVFITILLDLYVKSNGIDTEYGVSAWIAGIIAVVFCIVAIALTSPVPPAPKWSLTRDESSSLFQCADRVGCDAAALHRSFMEARK